MIRIWSYEESLNLCYQKSESSKKLPCPNRGGASMRMLKILSLALVCLCVTLGAAHAAPPPDEKVVATMKEVTAAYEAKDYAKAKKLLKPLVDKNDPYATFAMGLMAARGEGEEKNLKSAESWWIKSAAGGNPQAQFNLGYLYFKGAVGDQDLKKARELWTAAAAQKHPDALYGLGVLQKNGGGGEKDLPGAIKNFRTAADMGHPLAQFEMGQAYMDGKGVPQNLKTAKEWFGKAAAMGMPEAKAALEALNSGGAKPPAAAAKKPKK